MSNSKPLRPARRAGTLFPFLLILIPLLSAFTAAAAPYAAMVMDARSGKVLHSRNADTHLHPASLTKMMTLYVVFDAVERGEIGLDTKVRISRNAATEQPSKLGLKPGQRIKLRYLIRAAAVKSANDASTALAEAVSGSESAFIQRMNHTAAALGMRNTRFRNAHGLTETGHYSTARDMTVLGRCLFYHFPDYYNLFARRKTHAGVRDVSNTNRKLLNAYRGADGIKTGYTRAAGYNLVASAHRGNERIIATMFGGKTAASRNARVAELLDMGFRRAPPNVAVRKPSMPSMEDLPFGRMVRTVRAVTRSPLPQPRPVLPQAVPDDANRLADMEPAGSPAAGASGVTPEEGLDVADAAPALEAAAGGPIPAEGSAEPENAPAARVVEARRDASGNRQWGINVGRYPTRHQAERALIRIALAELGTLDSALRRVTTGDRPNEAIFEGMTHEAAKRACQRLQARHIQCKLVKPS